MPALRGPCKPKILVARIFAKKNGCRIYQQKKMFRHQSNPFMLADLDYFVELPDGTTAILECTTTNYNAKDKWWDGKEEIVPQNYALQGRHYMAVMNIDHVFYCCFYANNEDSAIIRHIGRDMETENLIFTSGLQVSEKQPPFGGYMSYQNRYYTLTEQRIPYQKDKTLDKRFFELTVFSIVKKLAREGEDFSERVLQVSLPVGLHLSIMAAFGGSLRSIYIGKRLLSKLRNKHQAELVISEVSKKHIYVTGHLCSPVKKGHPVGHANNGRAILTAQVVQILEACEAYVTFETANSTYTINYIQVPSGNYSICA